MACGRSLCSLSQLVIILVLYLSMSSLSSSGEPLRHSRYVDRDMFYAAVVFTKPSPPTMSSQPLRLTKPLRNPLDNTRIVMSSCCLLQKAFLAMVLTSMSNDISRDAGTRGAGGATAPLALQQEGQGGQRCPFSL